MHCITSCDESKGTEVSYKYRTTVEMRLACSRLEHNPFETSHILPQLNLFGLDEAGWLTALKLKEYAPPRSPKGPMALQKVLFSCLDAQ